LSHRGLLGVYLKLLQCLLSRCAKQALTYVPTINAAYLQDLNESDKGEKTVPKQIKGDNKTLEFHGLPLDVLFEVRRLKLTHASTDKSADFWFRPPPESPVFGQNYKTATAHSDEPLCQTNLAQVIQELKRDSEVP
jgi:hypothetical protein